MVEQTVTIQNRAGIHARPSAMLVQTAKDFQASIYLEKVNDRINGKSIMGILTLGASSAFCSSSPSAMTRIMVAWGAGSSEDPNPQALSKRMMTEPMTKDERATPMICPACWRQGVAPKTLPVLRSWVVSPAEAAITHMTQATPMTAMTSPWLVQPASLKTRAVINKAPMARPDIGLFEHPTRQVMDMVTETIKTPRAKMRIAPRKSMPEAGERARMEAMAIAPGIQMGAGMSLSPRPGAPPELKRDKRDMGETILNQLYRLTQMEISYGINMLAIVNQTPRLLNLKEALSYFVAHREEVVTRRARFDLAKAEARAHILEGLRLALGSLDEIIALIRKSQTPAEAKSGLVARFGLSEIQAQAILDFRLQRLTQLERKAIDDEYDSVLKDIDYQRSILGSETVLHQVIKDEFLAIKSEYGDKRRTIITDEGPAVFNPEDFIAEEQMVVTVTHGGYIKRTAVTAYRTQKRGGKGLTGAKTKEDDFVERMYVASTHSYLLFLTNRGRLYWLKVHEIPLAARATKGKALVNLIPLMEGERVNAVLDVGDLSGEDRFVVMATRAGIVKRCDLACFQNPRKAGIIALSLKHEGDELVSAAVTDGKGAALLSTFNGTAICFKEPDIRPMGRAAAGVNGIRLGLKDRVVAMDIVSPERSEVLMTVMENGYGKRTDASEYTLQSRGGMGVRTTSGGGVVSVFKVTDNEQVMLITNTGRLILFKVSEVRLLHRNTHGVKLMDLEKDEVVVDVAPLAGADDGDDDDNGAE